MTAVEPSINDWVQVKQTGLAEATKEYLIRAANIDPKIEICGFITNGGSVIPITNVDADPVRGYRMDSDEMVLALTRHEVAGIYHSHPSGRHWPSATDGEQMAYWYQQGCDWDYYIVTCNDVYRYEHKNRKR